MVDCLDHIFIGFFNLVGPATCSFVGRPPASELGNWGEPESTKLEISETRPCVSEDLGPRPPRIGRDLSREVAVRKAERLEGPPSKPGETFEGAGMGLL